jgi:hypothetical protein
VAINVETKGWKKHIVGVDLEVDPAQLLANPQNWRVHPRAQRAALKGLLDEVGFVAPVIVNHTTGNLLDGHMRVEEAITANETIPVFYVEISAEQEKLVLASFDPIGALATQDVEKHRELLGDVQHSHADLHKLLVETLDFGAAANPEGAGGSDGSLLKLIEVTVREPQHQVNPGDLWRVNAHRLLCAPVVGDPAGFLGDLRDFARTHGELAVFAPFPGPLVTLTRKADDRKLFMVQPDPYIAGHILDRSAEILGGDAISCLRHGAPADGPTADDLDPPPPPTTRTAKKAKKKGGK